MKKINLKKRVIIEAPRILRSMCDDLNPKDYETFIKFLDFFMMEEFEVKREELPWLNPHCKKQEWRNFISLMRLIVAKFWRNYEKQHFNHTKH